MSGRNTHLGVEEGRRWPRKPEKRGRAETLGAKRRESCANCCTQLEWSFHNAELGGEREGEDHSSNAIGSYCSYEVSLGFLE